MTEDYFEIGTIVNVHGLKGEIRVMPATDDPSRFKLLDKLQIFFGSDITEYSLKNAWPHKTMIVLKLAGIDDRNAAEKMVGGVIKVPRSKALPLEENQYYQKDLLDMAVVSDTGEELGQLVQIIETGANDVYVVRPAARPDTKGKIKDLLIPAIEECILSVSVKDKKMTVHVMEGLREL